MGELGRDWLRGLVSLSVHAQVTTATPALCRPTSINQTRLRYDLLSSRLVQALSRSAACALGCRATLVPHKSQGVACSSGAGE
jgi:hypothetical protein